MKNILFVFFLFGYFLSYGQYTGSTPYISEFGPNQSVYKSGANWKVINADENDIVFAVVNNNRVIAHAYINSGDSFMFKDLPVGFYSYKFENDGNYFEDIELFEFTGCDPEIYICDGGWERSIEVWVERSTGYVSGKISKKDFFNSEEDDEEKEVFGKVEEILEQEIKIVEEMNLLGFSDADNLRFEELKRLRKDIYKECIEILLPFVNRTKNKEGMETLLALYMSIGDLQAYNQMKKLYDLNFPK